MDCKTLFAFSFLLDLLETLHTGLPGYMIFVNDFLSSFVVQSDNIVHILELLGKSLTTLQRHCYILASAIPDFQLNTLPG